MTKLKNFIKNYKTKIIINYLKKSNFFLIFNVFINKTKNFNKKIIIFRLNCLAKIKMLLSVKKTVFLNTVKNSIFLINFKNQKLFLKDFNKFSFLHFSSINLNTKVYLFTVFKNINSFHYLQNKLLIFKHFILYLKRNSK
jgi:hypothetical protein